ncbi:hypothetical protein T4A_7056 [Trichinella pseudospiralis]|uniref:Uncharacterized protein n=1 Tax=Trichinella pseudospiralis TaxID=6337 RepID=A0A0V1DY39_TRIPS|nr:hypothetical protein T4A_7056 [Trichinella pseudospiralis]
MAPDQPIPDPINSEDITAVSSTKPVHRWKKKTVPGGIQNDCISIQHVSYMDKMEEEFLGGLHHAPGCGKMPAFSLIESSTASAKMPAKLQRRNRPWLGKTLTQCNEKSVWKLNRRRVAEGREEFVRKNTCTLENNRALPSQRSARQNLCIDGRRKRYQAEYKTIAFQYNMSATWAKLKKSFLEDYTMPQSKFLWLRENANIFVDRKQHRLCQNASKVVATEQLLAGRNAGAVARKKFSCVTMAARGQHVCSGARKKWHWSCQYTGSAILKSKQRTGENTHRIKGGMKSAQGLAKSMQKNWEKRALNITKRLHFVKKEVAKGNTKIRNGQCTCIFFGWKRAAPDGMSAQRRVRPSGCHNKTGAELQYKWTVVAELPQDREKACTVSGKERQQTTLGGICGHMRALCLKESVQWHGGKPHWTVKNVWFFECLEGENSSGAERVKSHGQYWVGRDKIVHNLLEGTRYRGIEMRAKMASGKVALGIM